MKNQKSNIKNQNHDSKFKNNIQPCHFIFYHMQKKIVVLTITVGVLAAFIGGYAVFKKTRTLPQESETKAAQPQQSSNLATDQGKQKTGNQNQNSETLVLYMNNGYSPAVLKIKFGDMVTFRNVSSRLMWTASNPHPAHNAYPVKGGCVASAFDQCAPAGAGQDWSFQFTSAGTWQYHNHLNPRDAGVVIVE